jgi:hypothetical protein
VVASATGCDNRRMRTVVIGADQDCRDSPRRQSHVLGRTIRPTIPPTQPKLVGRRCPATGSRLRWAPTAGANHSGCPASPSRAPSRCATSIIAEGEVMRICGRADQIHVHGDASKWPASGGSVIKS